MQIPEEIKRLDALFGGPEKCNVALMTMPTDELIKLIEETENTFRDSVVPVISSMKLFNTSKRCTINNLAQMGIVKPEQKLALVLQNLTQAKNTDRRTAIAEGTYWNPITNYQDIIMHLFVSLIQKEKKC